MHSNKTPSVTRCRLTSQYILPAEYNTSRTFREWPSKTTAYTSPVGGPRHEPGLGYAMYPRDYALVPLCHLLLAIRRRSNNRLAPVREESVHRLGERVEVCLACEPLMHRDGQKVKVMHSGFVADADANIAVRCRHVRHHVEGDRERPALSQQLRDALQIHRTAKTSIAAHNPLRARAYAPDAEYLFRLHIHL
jgi:hypothetical protein